MSKPSLKERLGNALHGSPRISPALFTSGETSMWLGKPVIEWVDETLRAKCHLVDARLIVIDSGRAMFEHDYRFAWAGSQRWTGNWKFWRLDGVPDDGTWDLQIAGFLHEIGDMMTEYLARGE